MARKLRVEFEGAIYHVTCRLVGDWRDGDRELFRDDHDRWRFLDSLEKRVDLYGVRLHQYVLMANHFHIVIETPQANCSAFMQSLLTSYTGYFNLRHGRHGHLFDGRYKAKLVQGDEYLLALSRYVHLNPVRVQGLPELKARRKVLNSYYWSSYLQYIGRRKKLPFVTPDSTLSLVSRRQAPKRYQQYVERGLSDEMDDWGLGEESPLSIGGSEFQEEVQDRYVDLVDYFEQSIGLFYNDVVSKTMLYLLHLSVESFFLDSRLYIFVLLQKIYLIYYHCVNVILCNLFVQNL